MALYNCSANSSNGNVAGSNTGCPCVDSDTDTSCGCSGGNGNVAGISTCSLGGLDDSVVDLLLLIAVILLVIALLN